LKGKKDVTARYFALTVLLDEDIREDDAEPIINAIKMIRHVLAVEPHVVEPQTWLAEERAKNELRSKLWEALR